MTPSKSIKNLLKEVTALVKTSDADPFYQKNLSRDLEHIVLRLKSGMYGESDFEARNAFDIPRRTEEFLRYLDGYDRQGTMWAGILRGLLQSDTTTILDLCPGWAPKIELALWKLGYSGTVHLMDTELSSLESIVRYMSQLRSDLKLSLHVADLFQAPKLDSMHIVVANHVVDDLLLHQYCQKNQILLSDLYQSEQDMMNAMQSVSTQDSVFKREFARMITDSLIQLTGSDSKIIMTQYTGLFERVFELESWSRFVLDIFFDVQENLLQAGWEDIGPSIVSQLTSEEREFLLHKNLIALQRKS